VVSLEVFNLLQIYNTVSYIWIKDINNRQYAVPNYLTPRLLNIKLTAEFLILEDIKPQYRYPDNII